MKAKMTDQTSTTEPRSSWNKRLISPKFNDELYLWMSTIPVICGLFQFLMTFGYYLGFLGLVFVGGGKGGGSSKSGVGALILVMFSLILTVGLFIAFITGFFYGLNTLKLAYDVARPLLFIWLAIVILGSLFKNTIKVKAVGDNELQYGLRSL